MRNICKIHDLDYMMIAMMMNINSNDDTNDYDDNKNWLCSLVINDSTRSLTNGDSEV